MDKVGNKETAQGFSALKETKLYEFTTLPASLPGKTFYPIRDVLL